MTEKKLLMGNEAIAFGAIEAGVQVVTGYPGTPSTEALETIARHAEKCGGVYAEWSSNEKVALETAAGGAAYSGAKALVTMKQVGLNVASDPPLMSLTYIGVKGALVLLVAETRDPPILPRPNRTQGLSGILQIYPSLTLQVLRKLTSLQSWLSKFHTSLKSPPSSSGPQQGFPTAVGDVELLNSEPSPPVEAFCEGFTKDRRWTIFPRLTAERHPPWLENVQVQLSDLFSELKYNSVSGSGKIGIMASGGVSALYVKEAVKGFEELFTLFRVGTVYPFPEKAALSFLKGDRKTDSGRRT